MKITAAQIKKIYATAREKGLDSDMIHSFVYSVVKKEHISSLTKDEGIKVIDALINPQNEKSDGYRITKKQFDFIKSLEQELGWRDKPERLRGFIKKNVGVDDIKFLTKVQSSKIIEGLKKLKKRRNEVQYGEAGKEKK